MVGSVGLKTIFITTHSGSVRCHPGCSEGLIPTKTPEQLTQFSGSDDSFCKVPLQVYSTGLAEIAFVSYFLFVIAWSSVNLLLMAQYHLLWISVVVCHWSLGRSRMHSHLIHQIRWADSVIGIWYKCSAPSLRWPVSDRNLVMPVRTHNPTANFPKSNNNIKYNFHIMDPYMGLETGFGCQRT